MSEPTSPPAPASTAREEFRMFEYDPARRYAWQVFDRITVACVTWNRLDFTKRFLDSVLQHSDLPHELLVVDNGSTDGTLDYLRDLATRHPHIKLVENGKNLGIARALLVIRDLVPDGLLIFADNDMEVLSKGWLAHFQKAFHAVRLARGTPDAMLAPRLVNTDEHGFRHATRHEVLRIPGERNDEPRTSYAAVTKDVTDPVARLEEEVVIGWSEFVIGQAFAVPASVFRKVRLEEAYPLCVGNSDSFTSDELRRLGVPLGYIENGPVLRHNDWPYTEEKARVYKQMTSTRAVTDVSFLRYKLRRWLGGGSKG